MATSNLTPNFNLSQYAPGDAVKFLTNYNHDMALIDAALKTISDSDAVKVPQTRTILGLPLSADITVSQAIAAGLCPAPENGTWTSTIYGYETHGNPTFTISNNIWTKIGNQVFVQAQITLTGKGGMAGAVEIGGLPFVARGYNAVGVAYSSNLNLASGHTLEFLELDSGLENGAVVVGNGIGGFSWLDSSELTDTSVVRIAGNYTVN